MTTVTMTSTATDALTARTKATWMAGDFGQIARAYTSGAADFITRLNFGRNERVLDVACGTGNLTIPAARSGAQVTGLDIAPNLIEQAQAWANAEGLAIQFDEGNAEQMPYPSATFDAVVTMFGAMFAPRPEQVAPELARVCRSGGRIAMANWTPDGFIGQMFKIVAKHVPPVPGVPSPLLWGNPGMVQERLGNQIRDLRCTARTITFTFPFDPAATVDCFLTYYGPTVRAYATLNPPAQAALRNDLAQHWAQYNCSHNGATQVDSTYLEVLAVRK